MKINSTPGLLGIIAAFFIILDACTAFEPDTPADEQILDGHVVGLTTAQRAQFLAGDFAFNDDVFTSATGLGPVFVATSCGSWHAGDGRGTPFTTLTRFGQTDSTGNQFMHMGGPQLQNRAIPGYAPEVIPAGATFVHPVRRARNVFAYVIEGEGYFDQGRDAYGHEVVGSNYFELKRSCICGNETVLLYSDGDEVSVSSENGVRFLLVSGKPIGEPVAWYGPIVMNTQEELRIAFEEYQNGTFIKHGNPDRR